MNYLNNNFKNWKNRLFVLAFIIMVVSCSRGQNDSKQTETPVQQPSQLDENSQDKPSTEPSNQSVSGQNDEQVMVNPPHGEPNHRCDIPVGSPLNSKADNGSSTASSNQPAAGQDDGEVMLNPPHGEPNHRCDIPVGSPLNSQTKNESSKTTNETKVNTTRETANNPYAPTVENAERLKSTRTNRTATPQSGEKPRVNPPHGESWHRCDIAVGDPLP